MPKTAELTGALLDYYYYVAKAEGLTLGPHQDWLDAVQIENGKRMDWYNPHVNWAYCGPMIEKHELSLFRWQDEGRTIWSTDSGSFTRYVDVYMDDYEGQLSDTPQEAICRAVVRAAFGDEVPEVAP